MARGLLVTVSGLDGVGKTTMVNRIADWLQHNGQVTITVKFPRHWVQRLDVFRAYVDDGRPEVPPIVITLLMLADRLLAAHSIIEPSLQDGVSVVCDRYGYEILAMARARGVDGGEWIDPLLRTLPVPDLALVLDAPVDAIQKRLLGRGDKRLKFEEQTPDRMSRLRTALRDVADETESLRVVDTCGGEEATWDRISALLTELVPGETT